MRSLGHNPAERIGQKASAPEFESRSAGAIAAHIAGFVPDPIRENNRLTWQGHIDPDNPRCLVERER